MVGVAGGRMTITWSKVVKWQYSDKKSNFDHFSLK